MLAAKWMKHFLFTFLQKLSTPIFVICFDFLNQQWIYQIDLKFQNSSLRGKRNTIREKTHNSKRAIWFMTLGVLRWLNPKW